MSEKLKQLDENEPFGRDVGTEIIEEQPKLRGFAALKLKDPNKFAELVRRGGSAVPAHKRAFSIDRNLASEAGQKGGVTSRGGGRPKKDVEND